MNNSERFVLSQLFLNRWPQLTSNYRVAHLAPLSCMWPIVSSLSSGHQRSAHTSATSARKTASHDRARSDKTSNCQTRLCVPSLEKYGDGRTMEGIVTGMLFDTAIRIKFIALLPLKDRGAALKAGADDHIMMAGVSIMLAIIEPHFCQLAPVIHYSLLVGPNNHGRLEG
ncbi:unnamed protein product [Polarella glacialis]|uniref:Uncharacterized protein n=1 Tax=Polarella glacialis TaxID=89957 RepID=A0A813LVB0_POLGL|nr:unnamed protein product [Polarella glacialis]